MKTVCLLSFAVGLLMGTLVEALATRSGPGFHVQDPDVMSGEWVIFIQHQPCNSAHNLQVIWPKNADDPLTVECNLMPVEAK